MEKAHVVLPLEQYDNFKQLEAETAKQKEQIEALQNRVNMSLSALSEMTMNVGSNIPVRPNDILEKHGMYCKSGPHFGLEVGFIQTIKPGTGI